MKTLLALVALLAGIAFGDGYPEMPGFQMLNDTSVGTEQFKLVKIVGGKAKIVTAGDTNGAVGICRDDCGDEGSAKIATGWVQTLYIDNASTAGHYLTISGSNDGEAHDTGGSTCPSTQTIGIVITSRGSAGKTDVLFTDAGCSAGGSSLTSTLRIPLGLCEADATISRVWVNYEGSGTEGCVRPNGGRGYVAFPDAATTGWTATVLIPSGAALTGGLTIKLRTIVGGSPGGNGRWGVSTSCVYSGGSWTFNSESLQTIAEGSTPAAMHETTFTGVATTNCTSPWEQFIIRVRRIGADGADTSTEGEFFLGVDVTYVN